MAGRGQAAAASRATTLIITLTLLCLGNVRVNCAVKETQTGKVTTSAPILPDIAISDSGVLLPHRTSHSTVRYQLEAFNGCFKW